MQRMNTANAHLCPRPIVGWHATTLIIPSARLPHRRKLDEVRALFEKYKPTHVVRDPGTPMSMHEVLNALFVASVFQLHLAALVGGLFINMKYKVEFLLQNLQLNNNVLQCCHEYKVGQKSSPTTHTKQSAQRSLFSLGCHDLIRVPCRLVWFVLYMVDDVELSLRYNGALAWRRRAYSPTTRRTH